MAEIIDCITKNDLNRLNLLVSTSSTHLDLNLIGEDGLAPLHHAAAVGSTEMVRILTKAGANIKICSVDKNATIFYKPYQRTPLHQAVEHQQVAVAELLVELGANVNALDSEDCAPLSIACQHGNLNLIKLLMTAGAKINASNRSGATPLLFTAFNGRDEAARLMINAGANVGARDNFNRSPARAAVENGHAGVLKVLIEADRGIIEADEDHLINMTAEKGNLDILKLLIGAGASVDNADDGGRRPIHETVSNGHVEATKLLIGEGADVMARDHGNNSAAECLLSNLETPIIPNTIREIFALLTAASATFNGATAEISPLVPSDVIRAIVPEDTFFWLAANNDAPMLAAELAGGLDPNMKTKNGMTLLHWACAGDAPECVQLLLEAEADKEAGVIAEECASDESKSETTDETDSDENFSSDAQILPSDSCKSDDSELSDSEDSDDDDSDGSDSDSSEDSEEDDGDDEDNEPNEDSHSPIFYCIHDSAECMNVLINAGVNVNRLCDRTLPIHLAMTANSPACVTALVGAGAWVAEEEMDDPYDFEPIVSTALEMSQVPYEALSALILTAADRVLKEMMYDTPISETLLHWAVEKSTVEIVRSLVEAGADPACKYKVDDSDEGSTVLTIAERLLEQPASPSDASRLTAIVDYLKSLPCFSE